MALTPTTQDVERHVRAWVGKAWEEPPGLVPPRHRDSSQRAVPPVYPDPNIGAPADRYPFATVRTISRTVQGYPHSTSATIRHTFSVQWYKTGAHEQAMRFAVWALTPKGVFEAERPLSTRGDGGYEGNDVHIRIERVGEVQLLDELTSTEWEERSALELEIGYVVTDNAAVGTFAGTEDDLLTFSRKFGRDALLAASFRIRMASGSGFTGYNADSEPEIGEIIDGDGEFERNGTMYALRMIGWRDTTVDDRSVRQVEVQIRKPAPANYDIFVAVAGSGSQTGFSDSDFMESPRRSHVSEGDTITIPDINAGNDFYRKIAIAIPVGRTLTSVTGHGFFGNLVDDMTKQPDPVTINGAEYSVWVSDNALTFGQHGIGNQDISVESSVTLDTADVASVANDFERLFFRVGEHDLDPASAAVSVSGREYRWTWQWPASDPAPLAAGQTYDVEVLNAAGEDHALEFRIPTG